MLSLGLGVNRSGAPPKAQDFYLEIDNPLSNTFSDYSVQGGALTKTANQTIDGSSGWLKIVYPDTDQTDSISGIDKSDIVEEAKVVFGRKFKVEFDIYLETADDWLQGDASNTKVSVVCIYGNTYITKEVTPDSSYSFNTGIKTVSATGAERLVIAFKTDDDLPEGGATFYIKNFKIRQGKNDSIFP